MRGKLFCAVFDSEIVGDITSCLNPWLFQTNLMKLNLFFKLDGSSFLFIILHYTSWY